MEMNGGRLILDSIFQVLGIARKEPGVAGSHGPLLLSIYKRVDNDWFKSFRVVISEEYRNEFMPLTVAQYRPYLVLLVLHFD